MYEILSERGVTDDRMILEDQAESAKDNFQNTAQIIESDKPVVLISSNYHTDRAVQTAEGVGVSRIPRLPSFCLGYGADVMCEIVLELNDLTLKR